MEMKKYWIHILPVEGGYLYKQWGHFGLGKKRYKDNVYEIQKEWTLEEVGELQKLPKFKNIRLKDCLEPYEPVPAEQPDFCTVVFEGADGDDWKVDYTLANIYIYDNGDIRYVHRDYRAERFDYRIVKIWNSPDDFDLETVKKLIKERRSYFAPDDKPIVVHNKLLGIGGKEND